jgi:hypothetical protein
VSKDRAALDEIEKIFMIPSILHGLASDLSGRVGDLYLVQLHARHLLPCSLFGYASEAALPLKRSDLLTLVWIETPPFVLHHNGHFALPAWLYVGDGLICDSPHVFVYRGLGVR